MHYKVEFNLIILIFIKDSSFTVIKQAGVCQSVFRNYDEAIYLLKKAHKQVKNDMEVMLHLANNVKAETSHTLLWYVHYFFLEHYKPEYERRIYAARQKSFSQFLLEEYLIFMHGTGKKKVQWQTFDNKLKTVTMDDLRKIIKL